MILYFRLPNWTFRPILIMATENERTRKQKKLHQTIYAGPFKSLGSNLKACINPNGTHTLLWYLLVRVWKLAKGNNRQFNSKYESRCGPLLCWYHFVDRFSLFLAIDLKSNRSSPDWFGYDLVRLHFAKKIFYRKWSVSYEDFCQWLIEKSTSKPKTNKNRSFRFCSFDRNFLLPAKSEEMFLYRCWCFTFICSHLMLTSIVNSTIRYIFIFFYSLNVLARQPK